MGEPTWGDEQWKDDEKVRVVHGENQEPWKTWDECSGPWKFPAGLMSFLMDAGFRCPTPIQAYTWPVLMAGKDVIGVAKTGSGKTLGYLLPGYIKVKREEMTKGMVCDYRNGPAMLVMAPTRELCQQIYEESDRFGKPAQIVTACAYGGAPKREQQRQLWNGPQCICATPGRLADFLRDGSIKLGQCFYLVLDEADRMLDMGFEPQIRSIVERLPQQRQTLLFTATWPKEVRSLASEFLTKPIHVQAGAVDVLTVNRDIEQRVIFVQSEQEKIPHVLQLLQSFGVGYRCLIFCEMKRSAEELVNELTGYHGLQAVRIHGDLAQYERTSALDAFKSGRSPIMVATDVAARGIDVKGVTCVINYDSPSSAKDYVHRIGRTGRAGQKGIAYSLLTQREQRKAQDIVQVLQRSNMAIPPELQAFVDPRRGGVRGGRGGKSFGKGGGCRGGKFGGKGGGGGGKGKREGGSRGGRGKGGQGDGGAGGGGGGEL
mmetsp:Transcript_54593/g.157928  ORF Transcript_54593/g.157928 Transcript_54593/m.157928 type:complete len:487 (-) Transcript_54593:51-1511(-)